jgi:hypothetical protein
MAASESSIDGATESEQFMSLPGTPTADVDETFVEGESVDSYLGHPWWLISVSAVRS